MPGISADQAVLSNTIACPGGCGAVFCSQACMKHSSIKHHALLCPGPRDPAAPFGGGVFRLFRSQAAATNDILILGAQCIAEVVSHWEANGHDVEQAMKPFAVFYSRPWWEVRG